MQHMAHIELLLCMLHRCCKMSKPNCCCCIELLLCCAFITGYTSTGLVDVHHQPCPLALPLLIAEGQVLLLRDTKHKPHCCYAMRLWTKRRVRGWVALVSLSSTVRHRRWVSTTKAFFYNGDLVLRRDQLFQGGDFTKLNRTTATCGKQIG